VTAHAAAADVLAQQSQPVTQWPARIGWTLAVVALLVALGLLMRRGWRRRAARQSDLPPLPSAPVERGQLLLPALNGRYLATTTAGDWLDRIVAQGLGVPSRAELRLTRRGLEVSRPAAANFFVPAPQLRDARLDQAIGGQVAEDAGLLIVTWQHGDRLLDSGFRADHPNVHPDWVDAVAGLVRERQS
jgi:hypothetical protein